MTWARTETVNLSTRGFSLFRVPQMSLLPSSYRGICNAAGGITRSPIVIHCARPELLVYTFPIRERQAVALCSRAWRLICNTSVFAEGATEGMAEMYARSLFSCVCVRRFYELVLNFEFGNREKSSRYTLGNYSQA